MNQPVTTDPLAPFSADLPLPMIVLIGIALAGMIYLLLFYLRRIRRVTRAAQNARNIDDTTASTLPAASIVVYSQDQASWLEQLLPDLLAQDYPAGFEIIVVNEGASDATRDLVEHLAITHNNLYLTYTPDGARYLSRKKLALTIGIKAAKNPVVVNTSAATRIPSPHWLRNIMAPFANTAVEVALGTAVPVDGDEKWGHRRRAFDYTADMVTWLTTALAGKPYRGTEYNLAYTRDIFFRNKGFSRSLNLVNGDDDIFINEIATGHNTAVVLSPESVVLANFRDHRTAHEDLRRRHAFTKRRLPSLPRHLMASGSWALWITLLTAMAAIALYPTNIIALAGGVITIATTLIMLIATWRGAMNALSMPALRLTIPWLVLMRPMRFLTLKLRSHRAHTRHYTWK